MKKLFLIIFLILNCSSIVYADKLGFGVKEVDFNFDCDLDTNMLLNAGFPESSITSIKKSGFEKDQLGYKKFVSLKNEELLLSIYYNKSKKLYSGPTSTVEFSKNEKGQKEYTSYLHGGNLIMKYKISELENGEMFLLYTNYNVNDQDIKKFDKLLDEAFKLSDDGFVLKLKVLTKEYNNYLKNNPGKLGLTLPYICKVL